MYGIKKITHVLVKKTMNLKNELILVYEFKGEIKKTTLTHVVQRFFSFFFFFFENPNYY